MKFPARINPVRVSICGRRLSLLPALMLVIIFSHLTVRAADLAGDFETGNKLYEGGRYADALAAYNRLLQNGGASEALLFNRGNALFKLGQLGRAIESYRLAQQLAPRDPDLRANLQFVRTRARGGAPYQSSRWHRWLESLSLNEWTALTAAALWVFFLLLALSQWRRELWPRLRSAVLAAAVAVLLLGVGLGIELSDNYFTQSAIVVSGETDIRNGPFDEAPSLYKVRDGAELTVLDRKDNWLQVTDSADRIGWVKLDQVVIFNLAAPSWTKS
jgi:tetratricopeptide (TPR) repeat protein